MPMSPLKVALLLLGSGACALGYQTVWLRELRLIFGAATPASAAVLAIFMGGLGTGSLLLGRRVERHPRPLEFYARLELMIAGAAALTPGLLRLARSIYLSLGGSSRLGAGLGTIVRLLLAALILSIPTLLMGGTLPAAARAVAAQQDSRRRSLALLYGFNTLGAVLGAGVSTFYLLEHLGNRATLWLACLLNVGIAGAAFVLARRRHDADVGTAPPASTPAHSLPKAGFVLPAAAVVGMAFLLMELVWYRMLGPLLGGSSFTFGLILAVALLGIGIGGLGYALWGEQRPATLAGFALTCLCEAVGIAVPYALGDRVALLAVALQPLGLFGFAGQVLGWVVVTSLVVLPAAIAAGAQFPLLIALLGRGREQLGRQVGLAYAWNTAGAIIGSLLGGFGLLPILSAPGTWRLVGWLLATLGVAAALLAAHQESPRRWTPLFLPALGALGVALLLSGSGPTAVWRHSGIGVRRADLPDDPSSYNALRDWENTTCRAISWEADGVESSVALATADGLAFIVNGKSDGSTHADAPTFVMGGMLGAILHQQPRRALVIGLGTGITAGWLAAIPSMDRVQVVEIEPRILAVARASAPVNQEVLNNPKVEVVIGDGREVLLTDARSYDLIVSQPSNPYRSGVASLFTQEYYQSARARLSPGGLFLQWVQAYEVDSQTVRTIYATLASVFPVVETWLTQQGDLLLVGALFPIQYNVPRLRQRIAEEPYKSALLNIMRMSSLEGLLGHYLADNAFAQAIAKSEGARLNTDDHIEAEFAFARSSGGSTHLDIKALMELAHARKEDQPALSGGSIDGSQVAARRISMFTLTAVPALLPQYLGEAQQQQAKLHLAYLHGDLELARQLVLAAAREPEDLVELSMFADLLVKGQDARAGEYVERLRALQPTEAAALDGLGHLQRHEVAAATAALESALRRFHHDPFPSRQIMSRALRAIPELLAQDGTMAQRIYQSINTPFAVYALNEERLGALINVAAALDPHVYCRDALGQLGRHIPWQEPFLRWRLSCYRNLGPPQLAAQAAQDLNEFLAHQPLSFVQGL